jgi:GT2 family glycosyltransferase
MAHTKNTPLVSIVILNWNRYEDTVQCLEYVRKLTYPNVEIIVVDNGSVDGSKDKLPNEEGIIYVDNPKNRGFTGGHIDGLAVSHGDFILLLNNDALIQADFIDKAMRHFEEDERVAVVGGRAYSWDDELQPMSEQNPFYSYMTINPFSGEGFFLQSDNGHVLEVNTVSGSSVIVRRSVVDEVGYLYDPFFAYFEETDLFARIKRAGYKVLYDPALRIWHKGGASSSSYFQLHQLFKNRFIFAVRNFQSGYLGRFLYIYTRIGLSSIARQWQPGEQQIMRKAYAKAFVKAWLSFPKHLAERYTLARKLGPSRYNEQIQWEERGISFLVDLDKMPNAQQPDAVTAWLSAIERNSRHEVIFVTANPETRRMAERLIGTLNIAKVAFDRRQLDTHSLNIAWLSSKYAWLYVSDSPLPPTITAIEIALGRADKRGAAMLQLLNSGAPSSTAVYARRFLIRAGGFKAELPLEDAKAFLSSYAREANWNTETMPSSDAEIISANATIPTGSGFTNSVRESIAQDTFTLRDPGRIDIFMRRHRHIGQLFGLLHWLLSPHISLRLKLSRLRNMLIFGLHLRRDEVATELKHIKNENARAHKLNRFEAVIREATEQQLAKSLRDPANVPVFIICRDRLSTLSQLMERLDYFGLKNIIFIDNDSAFPPLVEYFQSTPYQTLLTGQNVGHKSPWESGIIKTLAPNDFYIVTDPDVIPVESCPADAITHFLQLHGKHDRHQKIGFGLKIDDLPDHYDHKQAVITWEKQFWLNPLEPDVYDVPLDTTFALYKPFNYRYFLHPSIRTGGHYVARHLPWYVNTDSVDPEEQYYRDRASGAVTTWAVESLDETLQKELAKQPQQEAEEVA